MPDDQNPYGYAHDSTPPPKKRKTPLVGKTDAKQKAYYHKQRLAAEAGEKRGSTAATRTAAKIHQKTGQALTGAEGDLTLKPGASEDEQRGAVFGFGSAMPVGGIIGALAGRAGGPLMESIGRSLAGERAPLPTAAGGTRVTEPTAAAPAQAAVADRAPLPQAAPKPPRVSKTTRQARADVQAKTQGPGETAQVAPKPPKTKTPKTPKAQPAAAPKPAPAPKPAAEAAPARSTAGQVKKVHKYVTAADKSGKGYVAHAISKDGSVMGSAKGKTPAEAYNAVRDKLKTRGAAAPKPAAAPEQAAPQAPAPEAPAASKPVRAGSRASGTNPRAQGTSPRQRAAAEADKKKVPTNVGQLPKAARDDLAQLARDIDDEGTRGKYYGHYDESQEQYHERGAVESPGRPYNMKDVADAKRTLKEHGFKLTSDQAQNLLDEMLNMGLHKK